MKADYKHSCLFSHTYTPSSESLVCVLRVGVGWTYLRSEVCSVVGIETLGHVLPWTHAQLCSSHVFPLGLPKRMLLLPVMKVPAYPVPHYHFF